MTVRLRCGDAELAVDPSTGARWSSWRVAGLELLTSADVPLPPGMRSGTFVMAPYAGRLGQGRVTLAGVDHQLPRLAPPHAIHGTVAERAWAVVDADDTTLRCATDLGDGWPARGRLEQRLELGADSLVSELVLHAEEAMPVTMGWHPWFARRLARGADARWLLSGGEQYVRGPAGLPTGELVPLRPGPWDDCFRGFTAPPGLRWPGALELHVESSADHWVLFDERPGELCLEPQTGPPDAPSLGRATEVPAGGRLRLRCTWRWRALPVDAES
ncbi:aldose 1-epimerase [Modestobacter lapidis]|nr:aldose 1-epimerase [Modestobacter lapidis]